MKRAKSEPPGGTRRWKLSHFLLGLAVLYLLFISLKFTHFLEMATVLSGDDTLISLHESAIATEEDDLTAKQVFHRKLEDQDEQVNEPTEKNEQEEENENKQDSRNAPPIDRIGSGYGRLTGQIIQRINRTSGFSSMERMAEDAWTLGAKAWKEVQSLENLENSDITSTSQTGFIEGKSEEACPTSVHVSGEELARDGHLVILPCGLAAGSSITVMGTAHNAHVEYVPGRARYRYGDTKVLVSQFMFELQGLKAVDGEDPPRILHLNPRLKGDWSERPVIEHNTCYRMQWGTAQRCDGLPSKQDDDMLVDGFRRCEKWMRSDIVDPKESKTTSWFKRFIGHEQKPELTWPFPFVEDRLFVLTVRAGVEGFHISVGGRHVTSFPYRTGFTLQDATGLAVKGDVDVHSVYATSLPISHPSFSLQRVLEMSKKWKASTLPKIPIQLFVGILSATNHFAERMAVRKTWMQSSAVKSSNVVARFFVALGPRKEVNAMLLKEAAYFGDTVVLPFMDRYELVVLKTIEICKYGVHNVTASYIMKGDDDTFIRVDTVLKEINGISPTRSLYMGNLNLLHRPLRNGKWAVTYEEWPEEVYPPYANGPGYIISSDIARFIVSKHTNQTLRLFKMEDVSMGMWVEQFNSSSNVQYSHNWKFCQYGCMEEYYTAHYQSPRQMLCLWDKLARGRAQCCNFR